MKKYLTSKGSSSRRPRRAFNTAKSLAEYLFPIYVSRGWGGRPFFHYFLRNYDLFVPGPHASLGRMNGYPSSCRGCKFVCPRCDPAGVINTPHRWYATFKRCTSLWPFVQYFFIVLIVIAHNAYSNTRVIIKTGKWGWAQLYCYLRTAIASNNIGQGPHSGAWLGLIPSHLC